MGLFRSPKAVLLAAFVLALTAVLVLLPTSGVDTQPPVCWATAGYEVSCSTTPAWGSAAVILVIGGLVGWWMRRARHDAR